MLEHRHTTTGAADHAENRCAGTELSGTTARAACEPQALDGGAVLFGGTMKRAVVKRRRERSGHIIHGAQARGGFMPLALCPIPLH